MQVSCDLFQPHVGLLYSQLSSCICSSFLYINEMLHINAKSSILLFGDGNNNSNQNLFNLFRISVSKQLYTQKDNREQITL